MHLVRIGDAVVRLARLRELIDLYAEYLRRCPEAFYHGCVPADLIPRPGARSRQVRKQRLHLVSSKPVRESAQRRMGLHRIS